MNSPKKVLMLVHTFPPFGSVGGSIRLIKFLNFLNRTKDGWSPTIVTVDSEKDLLWLSKASQHSVKEIPEDVRVIKTDTREPKDFSPGNTTIFYKALRKLKLGLLWPIRKYLLVPDDKVGWQKCLEKEALKELGRENYSLIYATAPPFSVLLAAVSVARKTGIPLVLDIKDDWVVDQRFRGLRKYRKKVESRLEKMCMTHADKIITVTQMSLEDYRRKYPEYKDKFVLIPNGCDVSEYEKYWDDSQEKFEHFTLIHTGVFASTRNLSALFKALKRMVVERPEIEDKIQFIIIGKLPAAQQKVVEELGISNIVKTTDYVPRDQYVKTLLRAHLPVVINFMVPTLVPGKLYEYWGSRNKMLLLDSQASAAAQLVEKYNLGRIVAPDDENAIFDAVYASYEDWERGRLEHNDVSGLNNFDREFLTRQLESTFREVVN